MAYINNSWQEILEGEFSKDYFKKLQEFLDSEYENYGINPERTNIYRSLEITPYESVKVVIVGQDPCPVPGQSNGVAFSVPIGYDIPVSVEKIYDLLEEEFSDAWARPSHGCLESWAKQGVLLLNCILTVRQGTGQAQSHKDKGWEKFTDAIIQALLTREQPTVFILWGNMAKEKFKKNEIKELLIEERHKVITGPHPAASLYPNMDNYFISTTPFSETNFWLKEKGLKSIDWRIKENYGENSDVEYGETTQVEICYLNCIERDEVDSVAEKELGSASERELDSAEKNKVDSATEKGVEKVTEGEEQTIEDLENITERAQAIKL